MKKIVKALSIVSIFGISVIALNAGKINRIEETAFQPKKQELLQNFEKDRAQYELRQQEVNNFYKREQKVASVKEKVAQLRHMENQKVKDIALKTAQLKQHHQEFINTKQELETLLQNTN